MEICHPVMCSVCSETFRAEEVLSSASLPIGLGVFSLQSSSPEWVTSFDLSTSMTATALGVDPDPSCRCHLAYNLPPALTFRMSLWSIAGPLALVVHLAIAYITDPENGMTGEW